MIFAWIGILILILMWYAHATEPAVMQIIPNREVIIKGNPITFICTTKDSSSRYLRMSYKLTPTDTVGDGLAYIDNTKPKAKATRLQDISGLPVSIDPGNVTGQIIARYTSATCAYNAYTYDCLSSTGTQPIGWLRGSSPKTITIIDNDGPVKLSDIERCIDDTEKCARCGPRHYTRGFYYDPAQTARSVGDKINVTCSKGMSFPKGGSNTFVWFKRNGNAEWREITRGIQGKIPKTTTTPVREDGKCLPKETKQSTLVYVVRRGDGPRIEIRCEVVLVLADGLSATTESSALELCVIGVTVAPPTTTRPTDKAIVTTAGKAGSKQPPGEDTTTQKTKGKGTGGFSLKSGAGIAAISASCVVVLAAVVAGVYLVVRRRRRRAAAQTPSRPQSQNYYYDDVSQMSQTYSECSSYTT